MNIKNKYEFLKLFNEALSEENNDINSLHSHVDRIGGHVLSNDITISANNTSANIDCFQITGSIEILRIYGAIKTITTLANCTAAYFDLFTAGDAADVITKNNGVLSGMAVGTFFTKEAVKTETMTVINNATISVTEPATNKKTFTPFIVTQKTGADTFIRFNYTTSDAPANAVFTVYVEYREPPNEGGSIVAV